MNDLNTHKHSKQREYLGKRERDCVCVCVRKLWTAPVKRGHFIYLWLLCLRDGQGQAMCLLSFFVLWAGSIYEICLLTILLTLISLSRQCFTMETHLPLLFLWHWIERYFQQVQTCIHQLRTRCLFAAPKIFLQHVSLYRFWWSMSFSHVDCRCNPMEDWTPSIWIEQAGEAVIWLWETQC